MAVSMSKGKGGGRGSRGTSLTVVGDEAVVRMLKASVDRAQDASRPLEAVGKDVKLTPAHDSVTGALAASMRNPGVEATDDGFSVSVETPDYAGYVINGTSRQAPQPPKYDERQIIRDADRKVGAYVAGSR